MSVVKHQGNWRPLLELDRGPDGKRKRQWGPVCATKKEAIAKESEMRHQAKMGLLVDPTRQSFGQFLESEWLPTCRNLKPSTIASYSAAIRIHVIPLIGAVKLPKIAVAHLNGLYSAMEDAGKSAKTVRNTHTMIHKALGDALKWGKVARNVASLADPPKVKRSRDFQVWDRDRVRQFLNLISADRLHPLYLLALTTGMRRGELLGLRWKDVAGDYSHLIVSHTIVAVGYEVIQQPTAKTDRSHRALPLDPQTGSALKAWKAHQGAERLAWGPAWTNSGLVFTREDGNLIHPQALSDHFERTVKRSGLPKIRLHDLRHTYATLALEAGMKPWDLSDRLGHESVAFTLDTYRHAIQKTQETAAVAAAAFILGP